MLFRSGMRIGEVKEGENEKAKYREEKEGKNTKIRKKALSWFPADRGECRCDRKCHSYILVSCAMRWNESLSWTL